MRGEELWNASFIIRGHHEAGDSMIHSDDMPDRSSPIIWTWPFELANVFPVVVDLQTGEIVGPNSVG